jgi:hypothetical protein
MREHHFSPIEGSNQQEVELAKKFIVDAFGADWLESKDNATHPIKRLWNRDDALISIEFVSLGKAIQDLQTIDKKWLDKRIQDIKRNAQTAHGYVFEIMAISMIAMGGMKVKPSKDSTPGIDATIYFDDGFEINASIKNHDISEQERFFRERCHLARRKALDHLKKIGTSATVNIQNSEALTKKEWEDVEEAIESYRIISATDSVTHTAKGKSTISIYPLDAHPGFNEFSSDHFSDSFLVISAQHRNEQLNFKSKVLSGAKNLAKHATASETSSNVIILKVHASADVDGLTQYAKELLDTDSSLANISAVILYQTQYVRHSSGQPVVSHHTQTALSNDSSLDGHAIYMSPMFGVTSERPPNNLLTSASHPTFDLKGRYVFQAGDHFYMVEDTPNGKKASIAYLGPGLHAHSVKIDGNRGILFRGKFPKDENLTVL